MKMALREKSSRQIVFFSLGTILLISVCYFLVWPIVSFGSTDMWYHLNGGRYFFENGKIPQSGFFSFIAESRKWPNYYWLFQVFLYQLFTFGDYYALVIFRAFLYLATVIVIAFFLLRDETDDRRLLYFLILFTLFTYGLLQRYFVAVRPHAFSYLFIPLFLYLIEYKSRFLLALPLLAILWSNLHGIEYPVIFLISGAYLFEFLIGRRKGKAPLPKDMFFFVVPLVLTLWAVLINPLGFSLLQVPLHIPEYQFEYILELKSITFEDFFAFKLYPFSELVVATFKVLILVACFGCIKGIFLRKIRISHLLLFAGGMFLLTQAERFRYEAILLSLPLLKFNPLYSPTRHPLQISNKIVVGISLFIVLVSLAFFGQIFGLRGRYPFSDTRFPQGAVAFLNHIRSGGRVLKGGGSILLCIGAGEHPTRASRGRRGCGSGPSS